jgi:alanine racemase
MALNELQSGESVSYNQQWTASGLATTATVPFGYFEGLLR